MSLYQYKGVEVSVLFDENGNDVFSIESMDLEFTTRKEVHEWIDNHSWTNQVVQLYDLQRQIKELQKMEENMKRIIKKNMYDEGKSEILVDDIKCSYRMDISHRTDKKALIEVLKTIDKNLEEFQTDSIKEVLTLKRV